MTEDDIEQIKSELSKPIVLVGMMGAGKSYIGQQLSQVLGIQFYDSDKLIETKAGMPISDIFEEFGEEKFREVERGTIVELMDTGLSVVATGGGAVTNTQTLQDLKDRSVVIWLDTDIETLWNRVRKSQTRPLLKTKNPRENLQELMQTRRPLYAQAHICAQMNAKQGVSAPEILIKALCEFLNKDNV